MIALPWSLWLHVRTPNRQGVRLWLPLFLLWLILLPLFVLAFVVTALADVALALAGQRYHHYTRLLFGSLAVLAATRGTVVTVHGDETDVDISIR